ncbi:hypothetical protein A2160_02550 [Candidatus Beckwithbacteria bacterium RBG_13_42_9]|uniref:Gfo/Idh/MocA-like oxidoreductase N-terminal domain-containing protein n=1 Tax=Candidatus Beckwithbacteria bacterium RBG_13_42_9 TaxID=1797457 RepID=A0A1F5E7L8_9BACT|nr:MAG: hypothetical protein A2160_02550 [Candidatus Beckwithbacteria bacterium RBG_13_42_9]
MKNQLNVLIIGAGNIGAFYDDPHSKNILTHAHAFTKHKGFNLLGFVDTNQKKAERAAAIWKASAFSTTTEAFNQKGVDVAVVATPDEHHYEILEKISRFPVKLVLAEKPFVKNTTEAKEILRIYQKKKIPGVVNYTRRFVPEFAKIKESILKDKYGTFITGSGYYGKGIIHNGSHLIDLLGWLIGKVQSQQIIQTFFDFNKDDPSVSAVLKLKENRPFFLQAINCRLFSIFELDLVFARKRIIIKDLGQTIEEYAVEKSKIYKGYQYLSNPKRIKTSLFQSLYFTAENIYQFLTKGEKLKCTLRQGYETLKTCSDIIKESKKERSYGKVSH